MNNSLMVAWQQLSHQKVKLAAAAAGVVVAVMLMLVQLGIRQGAMDSSVAFSRRIASDLVVVQSANAKHLSLCTISTQAFVPPAQRPRGAASF